MCFGLYTLYFHLEETHFTLTSRVTRASSQEGVECSIKDSGETS